MNGRDMEYKSLFNTHFESTQDLSAELNSCAVVSILIANPAAPELLFIRRAQNPNDKWSGQIAFPGGRMETNETHLETALRETHEEIGFKIPLASFKGSINDVQGRKASALLSFYIRPLIFNLASKTDQFTLDPSEVDTCFWVSLKHLLNKENHITHDLIHPELQTRVQLPGITLPQGDTLWGLSYVMLTDLLNKTGHRPAFWKEYFK